MPRLQYKSFASPDEVRSFADGSAEIINLGEATIGRAVYQPGWRWSVAMPSVAGTESCQLHHLGYSISGTMHVAMANGEEIDIPPGSVFEIPPDHDAWVVGDEPWVTVEWTTARMFGRAGPVDEGVLLTVLFTDVVDSTGILERAGDKAWRERLLRHNTRLREQLNTYRGREVKTTGDGFLAVFDSAPRAVRCGAAMARAAREMDLPIRVGVHTGEVQLVGADAHGLAVHTAARVMSVGGPDDVIVSSTTHALLEGSGLDLEDLGMHDLQGLPGARRLFRFEGAESRGRLAPGSS